MELTTLDRILITRMIETRGAGTIGELEHALDIIKRMRLTPEELKAVGFRDDGATQEWDDGEMSWDIELSDKDIRLIKKFASRFTWPVREGSMMLAQKLGLR